MGKLVIVRHGQSLWNKDNKFTGWIDIELSAKGREEAMEAGKKLKDVHIDVAFTSELKRAKKTLELILLEIGQNNIPVYEDKSLNERKYGDLQGVNIEVAREKFGKEQVQTWEGSFEGAPPEGESLKDTTERVVPYYESEIEPLLQDGKHVLIAAHDNSLRAIRMYLEKISEENIVNMEIPMAVPRVYEMDEELNILKSYYLD